MTPLWLVIVATAVLGVDHSSANCTFLHPYSPTEQPLMLADNAYTDVRRFIRKDSSNFFNVSEGEYVTFVCPGSYNYLSGVNVYPQKLLRAQCVSGFNFYADGRTVDMNQVSCYSPPEADVLVKSQGTCGLNTTIIEVGYNIPAPLSFFLKLYEVCYDPVKLTPVNARHLVLSGKRRTGSKTYSAYLLPIEPASDYFLTNQIESFTLQLDAESANIYINPENYLEPKQIVPGEDFVFSPLQLSAYFYFNTIPLWNTFSPEYWNSMETSVRELADSEGDLEVYMEVTGVGMLPDSSGRKVPMFLHANTNELYLPLPAFLSKAVVNSKNQQVIFMQIVNLEEAPPFLAAESMCAEDVCAQLRWLPWRHVPAAERPSITCCRADDALLRRHLPRAFATGTAPSAGLLVGQAEHYD